MLLKRLNQLLKSLTHLKYHVKRTSLALILAN